MTGANKETGAQAPAPSRVRPEHIITLKGKQFVLFAGLLALAHETGLLSIQTEVLAELSDPKEKFWVVRATGRFRCAEGEAVWSAMGDASPESSKMHGAYLRHAETRATARMLRLAVNVGMCSLEELGPDVAEDPLRVETAAPAPTNGNGKHGCQECGQVITAAVAAATLKSYSKPLCTGCQKAVFA